MMFTVTASSDNKLLSRAVETEKDALVQAKLWTDNGLTDVIVSDSARDYTLIEFALRSVKRLAD